MPTGYTISKNGFKVWLQCKNCGEYFLVLPKLQDIRHCCSVSCARKLPFRCEEHRKFYSDLMKRRRKDLNSDFNRNNAKAVGVHIRKVSQTPEMRQKSSERAMVRNKTPEMRDARSRYMLNNLGKNGFYVSPHQIEIYNNLIPYLGIDSIELEVIFDMKGTRFQSEFGQRWIRVDLFHKSSGVIIEVDGRSHHKTIKKDVCRDETLQNLGYQVIRIKNEEVRDDFSRKQFMLQALREVINRESIIL